MSLGPLLALVVATLVLQVAFTFAKAWYQTVLLNRYTAMWRDSLFQAVMKADWSYFMRSELSAQSNAIVNDTSRISAAFGLALHIINAGFFVLVYTAISLAAAWQLVVLMLAFGASIYFLSRPLSRYSKRTGERVTEVSRRLMHHSQEFLTNAKLIKATASEALATRMLAQAVEGYRAVFVVAGLIPALITFIYMASGYIFIGAAVWFTLQFTTIDPAGLAVTIYVLLRLYVQVSNLQQLRESFLLSAPALPLTRAIREQAISASESQATSLPIPDSSLIEIRTERLSIDYDGYRALSDVSVSIPGGAIVGITGPSGAGKSTFVDAIVGLLSPTDGQVYVNEISLGDVDQQAWRRCIGYVGQETLLLQDTVAENIGWGTPRDATAAESIAHAAKLAQAHEFIVSMSEGYQTRIGGRGVRISGGQRQRIGLARALIGQKKLLILDEATSALDAESEHRVLDAIDSLRGSMTIVIIAHRLSTLRLADQVLVFDEGRIVQSGGLTQLTEADGQLRALWLKQSTTSGAIQ